MSTHVSRQPLVRTLLLASTVLMGLIAGFFYAYACSVMLGLARVSDQSFIETMQAINATVRNAGFAPSFFGSLVVTLAAAIAMWLNKTRGRYLVLLAFVLYAGAFAVTFAANVPLNDQLAEAGPVTGITDVGVVRTEFEEPWVRWNLVRTVLASAALGCLAAAGVAGRDNCARRARATNGAPRRRFPSVPAA